MCFCDLRTDNPIKAIRGVGFSVVSFDRLPQGLLILFGMFLLISPGFQAFANNIAISFDDGMRQCDETTKNSY